MRIPWSSGRLWSLVLVVGGGAGSSALLVRAAAPPLPPSGEVRFNRDIRPILSENCFLCHGPDPGTRKAGLRLDTEEGLFGQRKHGVAVVKGKPQESIVCDRIASTDKDEMMPPPESHKELKPAQRETIKRWIEQGASYEKHWALLPPVKPAVPEVANKAWVHNPIDAFVLAKLEAAGLTPAPEADRRSLIRRLSLDLTGLPPAPQDVEAFVNDTSTDAYERLVDRLLSNVHYGEHRARYWLDAARYADTHGLHFDNYREMWPYRDWVIKAFNDNLPFDRFTIEQLGGDLLPNRTLEQQLATGFVRCGITTNEGGTIPEENLVLYARDRTETAARVFLGLTMNCCVCHDHKFDPLTQKDFYSLSAYFNNNTMGPMDGNIKDTPPVAVVPAPQDRGRWFALQDEAAQTGKQIDARRAVARKEFEHWLATTAKPQVLANTVPQKGLELSMSLSDGECELVEAEVDGESRSLPLSNRAAWQAGHVAPKALQVGQGAAAEVQDVGDYDRNQAFSVAVWVKLPSDKGTGAIVAHMDSRAAYRGWDLWFENGRLASHVVQHWEDDALKVVTVKTIDHTKWHHVALTYDGTGKAAGVRIYVDGESQQLRPAKDALQGSIRTSVPLTIGSRHAAQPIKGLLVQDLRLYNRSLNGGEVKLIAMANRLAAIVAKPAAQRSEAEKLEVFEWYLQRLDKPSMELFARQATLDKESNEIKSRGAVSLVMQEKPTLPVAYVLYRGEYDKRRDEVGPTTPAALPPMPAEFPKNRLGLAQWLVSPQNPLTARVEVNRCWQEIFGTGIVKTAEDFGVMGEQPSHQELLDWLAVDFRENGWDVKRLLKQIVMSSTYRQAATVTAEKLERDPADRLLSRAPRFRLDAETLRDNALAVSGLLVRKIGGPSVRPYQPPGVWEAVAMPGSNTRDYKPDTGEGLYRRSLYTFWKRAAPPATMEIFNAPSRETCTVRRERTDTPLQALVTLNDPQFVEAARALAQGAIKSGIAGDCGSDCCANGSFEQRLDWAVRRVLARSFRPEESAVAKAAYSDLLAFYKAHPDDAKQLLSVGQSSRDDSINPAEHAAWTMLCNQLMNLDEALNK